MSRRSLAPLLVLALLGAPAVVRAAAPEPLPVVAAAPDRLYFSVELRSEGRLIGQPKVLGEAGRWLRVERRPAGSDVADYSLRLLPTPGGVDAYDLTLEVSLPTQGEQARSQLAMLHGEVKTLQLGKHPGDLEVELLLMKVDSPEFRALMKLPAERGPSAI